MTVMSPSDLAAKLDKLTQELHSYNDRYEARQRDEDTKKGIKADIIALLNNAAVLSEENPTLRRLLSEEIQKRTALEFQIEALNREHMNEMYAQGHRLNAQLDELREQMKKPTESGPPDDVDPKYFRKPGEN